MGAYLEVSMTFGENIKAKRLELGMSAEIFATKCGTSRSYISLIETGKRLPGKNVLPQIAKVTLSVF